MNAAITAFFEMIKQFLSVKQTDMEHKPTLEIVKEKKALKKATDYTEQMIELIDKYKDNFSKSDLRKYERLKRRFNKNN